MYTKVHPKDPTRIQRLLLVKSRGMSCLAQEGLIGRAMAYKNLGLDFTSGYEVYRFGW